MKQRKAGSNSKNQQPSIQNFDKTTKWIITEKLVPNSNKKLTKQIEKLQKQIQQANDDIKNTQKFLDVDLFLKEQKKKKMEHAKNINAEYEAQKKIREEKLYKKFNRDKNEGNSSSQIKGQNLLFFKTNNIPVFTPTAIVKSLTAEHQTKKNQWIRQGHIFKDQECNDLGQLRVHQEKLFSQLYRDTKENQKVKYDGDSEAKHIIWKDIKEVCENSLQIQVIPGMPGEHQFLIGASENENILNSLTLMTHDISSLLFAETQNTFSAKLNSPTKPLTVVSNKKILVREFAHKNVNLGARCQNSNIIWPTLVEKCFMKIQGSCGYKPGTSHPTIMESIYSVYGLDPEIVPITNSNVIKQNFYLVLGHLLQEGRVGFMNVGRQKKSCYQGRIYVLQSIKEEVVHQTKQEKKTDILFKIKDPWRGKLLDGSNRNKFNLLELLGHFNTLVLLKSYPQRWACLRINFSYFSSGSIGLSNNQWTKNPQYLFTITKKASLRIVLRKAAKNIQETADNTENIYGFLLFENKEAQNKIQCMKMEALIIKTKSNDLNDASFSGQLEKGSYIVIPYSTCKSEKAYQFFTFDFIIEKQSYIDFGKARIHEWSYETQKKARLGQDQKILQSLESKQKFEKPKIEKIDLPKLFSSKITRKIIEGLNLNFYENCETKHFFMPGFIRKLLINTSIDVELGNQKNTRKQKNKQFVHEELSQEEQAQNLSILLGYDAITDEINQGRMKDYIEQSVGVYDFRDFGLGEEGLVTILESLCQHPQVIDLDLSGNLLNDSSIVYLCYYLQKSNRIELRSLKLHRNNLGFNGKNALQGLKTKYPKLNIEAKGFNFQ